MEYLDFELPIKALQEQYEKACQIGEDNDVDVTNTCEQIEIKLAGNQKRDLQKHNTLATCTTITSPQQTLHHGLHTCNLWR